jgi:hypothetical protein
MRTGRTSGRSCAPLQRRWSRVPIVERLEPLCLLSVFTVKNTADSGPDSLRQAILDSNSQVGPNTIDFQIGAGGPQSIALLSALPATTNPVTIDGTSQTGYAGFPLIELNGAGAGAGANGVWLMGGNSTVKGLVIDRFQGSGIRIDGAGADTVQDDFIGTDPAGTKAQANAGDGVYVATAGNTIGGTMASEHNLIAGNLGEGIRLVGSSASQNLVEGNGIGLNLAGTGAIPNGFDGVFLDNAQGNLIGGTSAGSANVISGNGSVGVRISGTMATGNLIVGNFIGTQADGSSPLGNGSDGVFISGGATGNVIGGLAAGTSNTIAFNAGTGVGTLASLGNPILSNAIFGNAFLGIDIGSDGLTKTNLSQLISAFRLGQSTIIQGTIQSTANTKLALQFFASATPGPSGYGPGQTYLGINGVMTDSAGNASFRFSFPVTVPSLQWVTATATDPAHTTWEFSQGVSYQMRTAGDYDGDGKADPAVYRSSAGLWTILGSSSGLHATPFGQANVDTPIPADFDVDGKTDKAVFRPPFADWLISGSKAGNYGFQFGGPGDIPVPADYDGDGKTDAAVFRPSNGTWYVIGSRSGPFTFHLGQAGDIPLPGDYEGTGKVDLAVFRPSTGTWYIQESKGLVTIQFGQANVDIPAPADYDGDGKVDLAVYRPTNGTWYILRSTAGPEAVPFGIPKLDLAVPADYDGDGKADIAVYRPSTSQFLILPSSGGSAIVHTVGTPGLDLPANLPTAYRMLDGLLPFTSPSGSAAMAKSQTPQSMSRGLASNAGVLVTIPADATIASIPTIESKPRAPHVHDAALEAVQKAGLGNV